LAQTAEGASSAEGIQPHLGSGARRVLVVDDNRDASESLSSLLGALGHQVREVHDGASAVAVVPTFKPDFVVLDIGLPDMDGFETARRIRELPGGRDPFILAASGYGETAGAAREAGIDAYLVKPLGLAQLQQILASTRAP
jgi:CheY-like chemotaxis protein